VGLSEYTGHGMHTYVGHFVFNIERRSEALIYVEVDLFSKCGWVGDLR
jgi:hypothetical protein